MRIVRPEQPSNTYVFYDADGEVIRRQKVVLKDTLFAPETQATSPKQGTFLGWYVGKQKLDFSANGTLLITELSEDPEGSEIQVFPKFSKVLYVTFYDEDRQTILSRQPVELAEGASSGSLDISSITAISQDPTKNFVCWQDEKENDVTSPVEVSEDMKLYPHFGKGYWLTFNANPTPEMDGVQIDYIAPQFVEEGKTAKEPEAPKTNSAGFSFEGWFKDNKGTEHFNFSTPINQDTTVYARWKANKVPFKIIVWEQNVNDDKNTEDDKKHYDVYKVDSIKDYPQMEALPGTLVKLDGNAPDFEYGSRSIEKPEGAFNFNSVKSNIDVTVDNLGNSCINLYYDRALLTIDFHNNGNEEAEDGEYTGLYGQTLKQNEYTWPKGYWVNKAGNFHLTFLDAFIFDHLPEYGNIEKIDLFYQQSEEGVNINFYKQKLDGTYPDDPAEASNTITAKGNSTFHFTNKYNGFTTRFYHLNADTWKEVIVGSTSVYTANGSTLDIRCERNKYNVEFFDGAQLKFTETKFFEEPLSDLSSKQLESPNPAEKIFGGWAPKDGVTEPRLAYDFSPKTMPANNLSLYAIWVPVTYHVELDVNGGTMADSSGIYCNYGQTLDDSTIHNMKTAYREGYDLVGWVIEKSEIPWNYGNSLTSDFCDEKEPAYNQARQQYVYTLHLKAKWRLIQTISMVYDLNGGSGTSEDQFKDYDKYKQDAMVRVLPGVPKAPPSTAQNELKFVGWSAPDGMLYQPGDTFKLIEEMIVTSEGKSTATLKACYSSEVLRSIIIYHSNDKFEETVRDTGENGKGYEWNAEVQLKDKHTFSGDGRKLLGWNSSQAAANQGIVEFACGSEALVSALATKLVEDKNGVQIGENHLYAVWERVIQDIHMPCPYPCPTTPAKSQLISYEKAAILPRTGETRDLMPLSLLLGLAALLIFARSKSKK